MIASLRGILLEKEPNRLVVETGGIGYEVSVPVSMFGQLGGEGSEVFLFIIESVAMYGGGMTRYGFISREEKEIFELLREIPGTGAKKALDYLDKIAKSAPDFRRAILEQDARTLTGLFGFTKKTADKMLAALKDRVTGLHLAGKEKWSGIAAESRGVSEAISALIHLGYRELQARTAVEQLPPALRQEASAAELIKQALQHLA